MMFNFLFGTARQVKTLDNIHWIDKEVKRFFAQDIETLMAETEQITQLASEAKKREQMATAYFQGLSRIEQAKLQAKGSGYQALTQANQSRSRLRSLKSKLLEASRG